MTTGLMIFGVWLSIIGWLDLKDACKALGRIAAGASPAVNPWRWRIVKAVTFLALGAVDIWRAVG